MQSQLSEFGAKSFCYGLNNSPYDKSFEFLVENVTSPQLRQKISSILVEKNRTEKDVLLTKTKSKILHSFELTSIVRYA